MPTLLTGATGFVGSAVLRNLLKNKLDLRVLVRRNSDRRNIEGIDCEVVVGDLNDEDTLRRSLKGCEFLFHVAADYRIWVPNTSQLFQTNRDATVNLLKYAGEAGIKKIVYTSSVATLGIDLHARASNEETPVTFEDMVGDYKRSKFLAEEAVSELIKVDKLPIIIVNPSTPVGPRDVKPTPTGRMILQAALGRMPAYVNTGLNLVHVDDVAEGHFLAFKKGRIGERYILGGKDFFLKEILTEIASIVGGRPPKMRLPVMPLFPLAYTAELFAKLFNLREPMLTVDGLRMSRKRMFFSSDKAMHELQYRYRSPIDGLRDAIEWFRAENYM